MPFIRLLIALPKHYQLNTLTNYLMMISSIRTKLPEGLLHARNQSRTRRGRLGEKPEAFVKYFDWVR